MRENLEILHLLFMTFHKTPYFLLLLFITPEIQLVSGTWLLGRLLLGRLLLGRLLLGWPGKRGMFLRRDLTRQIGRIIKQWGQIIIL